MKTNIYLISDSSGNLLEHFLNAILTQFPREHFSVIALPFTKDEGMVFKQIEKMKNGVVLHAVVSVPLKNFIADRCLAHHLKCIDVTGPAADFLEQATGVPRLTTAQPLHGLSEGYMARMKALEFAMQHDDGRRLEDLDKAEIVLIGVSRVSKSPTALFLGYRGFKVANVSLVSLSELPGCLGRHAHKNVVALTMNPKKLAEVRHRRFADWKIKHFNYDNVQEIVREIAQAESLYQEKGWPVIDTTELSVEETSTLILSALKLQSKIFEPAKEPLYENANP